MIFYNKQPKSVLEYYVHLYTRKKLRKENYGSKVGKKNLITEATVSWLKLNSKKRQIITTRFQTHQLKLKKNFADKLRTAVPLPKKTYREAFRNNSISNLLNSDVDNSKCTSVGNCESEDLTKLNNTITANAALSLETQENEFIQKQFPALMLEPTPPAFRTTKDFYNLLNKRNEKIIAWDELSRGVKGQYERAATRIRRNYIQSYTSFLETLTPIELFNYYKSVTDV